MDAYGAFIGDPRRAKSKVTLEATPINEQTKSKQSNQQQQRRRQKHIKMTNHNLSILVITSTLLMATMPLLLLTNSCLGLSHQHHQKTQHSRQAEGLLPESQFDDSVVDSDDERAAPEEQPMPESLYKNAPLLFGANIMTDYYNEASKPRVVEKRPAKTAAKKPQKSSPPTATAASASTTTSHVKTGNRSSTPIRVSAPTQMASKSATFQKAKSKTVASELAASMSPEITTSTLKDMARSGLSMDQVLSSLGLVVEAMKQQTMAMQLISGQMAAKTAPPSQEAVAGPVTSGMKAVDAMALLESFSDIMGGLRGARSITTAKPETIKTVIDSFGDQVRGTDIKPTPDDPFTVIQQPVSDVPSITATSTTIPPTTTTSTTTTTTTPRPTTTTTTTTTTTPRPTTILTTTTSTTTTPAPTIATTEATTAAPKIVTSTTTEANKVKIGPQPKPNPSDWRKISPFDFYPFSGSVEDTKSENKVVSMEMPIETITKHEPIMFSQPMMASSVTSMDGYKSVGMPSYSSGNQMDSQQQHIMMAVTDRPEISANYKQHQQAALMTAMMQQPQFMSMLQQQQLGMHQMQQQMPSGKLPQYTLTGQIDMNSISQQQQQQMMMQMGQQEQPMSNQTPPPSPVAVAKRVKMLMSMMAAEDQKQQENLDTRFRDHQVQQQLAQWMPVVAQPQNQMQTGQQQLMGNVQSDTATSDEIPKPPMMHAKQPPVGLKGVKQALKIGEKPAFSVKNFQMLSKGSKGSSSMEQEDQQDLSVTKVKESTQDLNGNASEWSSSVASSTGDQRESQPSSSVLKPAMMQPASVRKPTSFSVLGGRFKITPHTQMLQYLFEPSKNLLQHALGQLIGPSAPAAGQQILVQARRPPKKGIPGKAKQQTKQAANSKGTGSGRSTGAGSFPSSSSLSKSQKASAKQH